MKKQNKSGKNKKKVFSSIALGALVVGSGALGVSAVPLHHHNFQKSKELLKLHSANQSNLLNTSQIWDFKANVASISPEPITNSVDEKSVIQAENDGNYLKWVRALDNIEGFEDSEPLTPTEFDLLAKLRQKRSDFEASL